MATKTTITTVTCCTPLRGEPINEANAEMLAKQFAALADPVRLRLYSLVLNADEVCSCDMTGPVGKAQPTVSHHTKILVDAGLIEGEKRGRWVFWRAVPGALKELRDVLK